MAAAILLALASGALGGCGQLLSIGRNGVVPAVAVDSDTAGSEAVTLQLYHHGGPSGGGGGAASGGGSTTTPVLVTLTGSGPDTAQAVAAAQTQTDVRLGFWATDLVLIGQPLAARGVRQPLDYLLRTGDFSLLAQVAVVRGDAGALLRTAQPGGSGLEIGQRLTHSLQTATGSIPVPFWRFFARLSVPYAAAWAPAFIGTPTGYRADGTALFRGDTLAGFLDAQQTDTLSWLLKPGGFGALTFTDPLSGRTATVDVVGRTRRQWVTDAGTAGLALDLRGTLRQGAGLSLQNAAEKSEIERAAADQAERNLRDLLDRLQAAGTDVLDFGELEREQDPAAISDWPRWFSHLSIRLRVSLRLLPGGRLG
jgi:spore germination protein KC